MTAIIIAYFVGRIEVLFVLTDSPHIALGQAAWHGAKESKLLGWVPPMPKPKEELL